MFPQRKDLVEKYGAKYGSEMATVLYNGPFKLTKWTHNSELMLEKNPTYWDNKTVKLNKVTYKIISDENAVYNSLQNGSIDSASVGKPEWITKFKTNKELTYFQVVNPTTFFQFFNTKDSVFKNANIRKAFSLAINREELAKVIFHDINVPAYGWVAPNININGKEYRSIVPEPLKQLAKENPSAKALLIKGLTELKLDKDPAKLTVRITLGATSQWFRTYGEYIQQMYNEALGVTMKVEQVEWPVFSTQVSKGDFQIGYMAWGAEYNEPSSLLGLLKSDAGAIETGWKNDRYDQLITKASKEMNVPRRLAYYKEAEQILIHDEAVIAPTVYPKSDVFRYSFIKGLGITPFDTAGYKYTYTQGRK
jgi:oligopeptide transport system substrate-binding protein